MCYQCIYGPRHSESVATLSPSPSPSRAELQSRSDAFLSYYLQSESVTDWATKPTPVCLQSESVTGWAAERLLCLRSKGLRVRHELGRSEGLRFRHSASQSPSRAGLLCCHCIYGASPTGCSQLLSVYVRSEADSVTARVRVTGYQCALLLPV